MSHVSPLSVSELRRIATLQPAEQLDELREQITALRRGAAEAGDLKQVAICDRAVGRDVEPSAAALQECLRVLLDAAAQS